VPLVRHVTTPTTLHPVAIGPVRRAASVALVRPPVVVMPGSLATHGPTPPIGLAYVAAVLRDHGHRIQLIDAPGEAIEHCVEIDSPVGTLHRIGLAPADVVERLATETQVVGITNMFLHEWPQVREIARLVATRLPDATVVVGGENATAFAPWILAECPEVDACVLGEGEATMATLVAAVARGEAIDGIDGVATRTAATDPGALPPRLTKAAVATVPRPAWDLVPLDRYWSREPFFGVNRGRAMQVLGTRGCPYKCSFCSSPQMWTTKFVVRDPDDVVDEIARYVERYGVENVNFVDLTAATNRKWTLGLCDALERRALGITWQLPVGTRTESVDEEVMQRLHDTGCTNITFAPESGSERMLQVMDKRADLAHILDLVGVAHRIGLRSTVNIIVGHPAERWRDTIASWRFLVRAALRGGDDCAVIMFCPYPGSRDYADLVESGRHTIDEAALYVGLSRSSAKHRSWNEHMSPHVVRLVQMTYIVTFYALAFLRRPGRIVQFVRSLLKADEDTYLDQMIRTRRRPIEVEAKTARPLVNQP
jgi:anaerobic magnesium-protoporphyrin IX monomethyl ester cyclase